MKSPTAQARSNQSYSVSELRLNLTDIVHRVQREKIRVVVRRRFDVVAVIVPFEDYSSIGPDDGQTIEVKSIREAREGIAGLIDKVLSERSRFIIYQRGEPVAAVISVADTQQVDPELHAALESRRGLPMALAAATSPVLASTPVAAPVDGTEVILASERRDQSGNACVASGMLVLRSRMNRRILSGVIQPTADIRKLMIRIRGQFISSFLPVKNKSGFYDVGEVDVEPDVTADDVEFVRLA